MSCPFAQETACEHQARVQLRARGKQPISEFQYVPPELTSICLLWWIRQAIARALADKARTIRIPVHVVEKLNKIGRAERKLVTELGREPTSSAPPKHRSRSRGRSEMRRSREATANILLLTAMQRAVYASEAQHIVFSGQLIAQFADSNRLASDYGLDSCLVEGVRFATS